jgi:hypothetical protein
MFGGGGLGQDDKINQGVLNDSSMSKINEFISGLDNSGVLPYFCMLGIPTYAQSSSGTNLSTPDSDTYKQFCSDISSYFKTNNQRVIYETWNEPDLNSTSYWTDGMPSFIDTSILAAQGYKQGNPDATVIELGLCWPVAFCSDNVSSIGMTLWDYYMQKTKASGNSIDGISWHYYGDSSSKMEGCADETDNFSYYKNAVRAAINRDNEEYDLSTLTQNLTEYHPSATGSGLLLQTGIIPNLYSAIDTGLATTDVSRISWNSFLTEEFGLIDPYSWQKRPVFYVMWSYGRLPVEKAARFSALLPGGGCLPPDG